MQRVVHPKSPGLGGTVCNSRQRLREVYCSGDMRLSQSRVALGDTKTNRYMCKNHKITWQGIPSPTCLQQSHLSKQTLDPSRLTPLPLVDWPILLLMYISSLEYFIRCFLMNVSSFVCLICCLLLTQPCNPSVATWCMFLPCPFHQLSFVLKRSCS